MSYTQKRHSRAQNRHHTYKHIHRKMKILQNVYDGGYPYGESKNNPKLSSLYSFTAGELHRLSKSKIHCSCPMCREKTREVGFKHSDKLKTMKGYE